MTITFKKQDLFTDTTERRIIVHGCNAQGVMGSGFALALKNNYPEAYEDYIMKCTSTLNKRELLGQIIYTQVGATTVVSAITQLNYGRHPTQKYVSYDAVYTCLSQVAEYAKHFSYPIPIHMPFIGSGLGNGDKDILLAIFDKTVGRLGHTTIFEL